MAGRWLAREVRFRYARSLRDFHRRDARVIAVHLHDALPRFSEADLGLGFTSSVYTASHDAKLNVPLSPYDELMAAASELGAAEFWFTAPVKDGGTPEKQFTILVVENPPPGDITLDDIEPPDFITKPPPSSTVVTNEPADGATVAEDDVAAEAEPEAEADCHE